MEFAFSTNYVCNWAVVVNTALCNSKHVSNDSQHQSQLS